MTKRIVSLIVAIILVMTMGACEKDTYKPTNPSVSSTNPATNTTGIGENAATNPTDNTAATLPSEPTEPDVDPTPDPLPTEPPTDIEGPVEPSEPTDIEQPSAPTEPSVEPEDPGEPTIPAEPAPVIPIDPTIPTVPTPPEDDVIEVPVTPTDPVVPHVHDYTTETTSATCTTPGKTTYTCSCGHSYGKVISELGHNFDERYYIAPTPESEGREGEICKRCGYDKYQVLEKLPPLATNEDASEIEALIIQYINEYRAAEGACATKRMEGCDAFTQYRSKQMAEKGKVDHNTADIRAAATAVKYGVYTDPSIYGLPGDPYYAIKGREAVGMDSGGSIEYVAKTLASGFHDSTTHWSYLGSDTNGYISVGATEKDGKWYCCIVVAPVNLDENPDGI